MADFNLTQTGEQVQEILNNAPTTTQLNNVADNLSTEITNRQNADNTLQGNIDAEELARQQADNTLQGNIDGEETRAKAAEQANANAIATKQNILTFDDDPTANSNNPVKSGGVKTALDGKQDNLVFDVTPTENSQNPVYSGGVKTMLDQKQNQLTFDNQPVQYSANPVKSAGLYDIWQAILSSISGINEKIPNQASASNQLADKAFVNSSIATSTATFRGTSAAGLTEAQFLEWANGLTKDDNDYVFWNTVDSAGTVQYKRYKYNGSAWVYEYTLNNSSFTSDQWAAINSAITSQDVTKLAALPTRAQLDALLAAKQDTLTFDATPTSGSNNPVKSGGVYSELEAIKSPAAVTEITDDMFVMLQNSNGTAFKKALATYIDSRVRAHLGALLSNLDKGTSFTKVPVINSSNDLGSATIANLASVLGAMNRSVRVYASGQLESGYPTSYGTCILAKGYYPIFIVIRSDTQRIWIGTNNDGGYSETLPTTWHEITVTVSE